jgi:uncharacterized protein (DUF58 family)
VTRTRDARRAAPGAAVLGELARLRRLVVQARRGTGMRPGDHRVPGRPQPSGIEPESHAAYAPGDDLRHLDWNALARLDALLVRRFTAEREIVLHLLVDCSASMGVPPGDGKLAAATGLATALAHVALWSGDAVRVAVLGAGAREMAVLRDRGGSLRVHRWLDGVEAGGAVALDAALGAWASRHPTPGVAVVISDLLVDPLDVERGVGALRRRGYDVTLVHVVGPNDVDPDRQHATGLLRDVETGATHPMKLTPQVRATYARLLAEHWQTLGDLARRLEARYVRVRSDASTSDVVLRELASVGLVRRR